ncbi:class B sortase [Candidatus Saccharibacteria bacterium]|nr:class B sortase [Candidatus Saccharibacteria bacterium]
MAKRKKTNKGAHEGRILAMDERKVRRRAVRRERKWQEREEEKERLREEKRKSRTPFQKWWRRVAVVVGILAVVYGGMMGWAVWNMWADEMALRRIHDELFAATLVEEVMSEVDGVAVAFLNVEFEYLWMINADTVGWLRFGGVDFPVVLGIDNETYLEWGFDGLANERGAIFMDYRHDGWDAQNTVIYGYRRGDGQDGFGPLERLFGSELDGELVRISTPWENLVFEVFAVYETRDFEARIEFEEGEFMEFVSEVKERNFRNFGVSVSEEDRILTLVTHSGVGGVRERTVVYARLVASRER